jgi:dipeptidyl aminopeptidase/acylaminoacyl peptidase
MFTRIHIFLALPLAILATFTFATDASADVFGGTRHTVQAGEYQGFVIEPPEPGAEGERPWIWYAPILGNGPSNNIQWMARQLVEKGFYVVGVNVGESMGNPAGRKGYSQFYDKVVKQFKLEPKARLLAQSRGGLMLYNWAAENADKVRSITGIYTVCDLRSYPRLERAAQAYGTTVEDLEKHLAEHNPIDRLAPLAKAGIPILHIHGDVDKLVPLEKNSQVVHDRYKELGGKMEIIVVPGKGHEAVKEFFEDQRLVDFMAAGGFPAKSGTK